MKSASPGCINRNLGFHVFVSFLSLLRVFGFLSSFFSPFVIPPCGFSFFRTGGLRLKLPPEDLFYNGALFQSSECGRNDNDALERQKERERKR